jgi:hypothetical protein
MALAQLSAFAQQFKETLQSELITSDRNSINFLKGLAQENADEHLNIIVAVQQHIYEVSHSRLPRWP